MCDSGLENRPQAPYIMAFGASKQRFGTTGSEYPLTNESRAMTERNTSDSMPDGIDLAVEVATPKLKRPSLYRVILINDDYTPMEFVVEILESVFGMERNKATRVMLEVHTKGKGICGVFTYEIAETKVAQVMGIAQQQQHPLMCTMEES